MKNASSISSRGWRHSFAIISLALLIVLGAIFGLALPCGGRPDPQELAPIPGLLPRSAPPVNIPISTQLL